MPVELVESLSDAFSEVAVDRENKLIKNVAILGAESKTIRDGKPAVKRRYSEKALQDGVQRVKGAPCFLNHRPKNSQPYARDIRDFTGNIVEARVVGRKIQGDVKVAGPNAELAMSLAESCPQGVGLSLRGNGDKKFLKDHELVESITDVESVDFVAFPATTSSLRESVEVESLELKEKLDGILKEKKPALELIEAVCSEVGVTFDAENYEVPKPGLLIESLADLEAAAKDNTVIAGVLSENVKYKSRDLARKAITDHGKTLVKPTDALVESLATMEPDAMIGTVKAMADQIKSVPAKPEQRGRSAEGAKLSVDSVVRAVKGQK